MVLHSGNRRDVILRKLVYWELGGCTTTPRLDVLQHRHRVDEQTIAMVRTGTLCDFTITITFARGTAAKADQPRGEWEFKRVLTTRRFPGTEGRSIRFGRV